jgi:hypothetical protein
MNFKLETLALGIIDTITELLDEHRLAQEIDHPIEEALTSFQYEAENSPTKDQFHDIVARFIQTVYVHNLEKPPLLDPLSHAIAVLENQYQGVYARGYTAARIEANNPQQGGIDAVLQRLAESITASEREKYVRAVIVQYLNPADWKTRCEIAKLLLEYCQPFLPQEMHRCVPSQFADDIPLLMNIYLNNKDVIRHISSSS